MPLLTKYDHTSMGCPPLHPRPQFWQQETTCWADMGVFILPPLAIQILSVMAEVVLMAYMYRPLVRRPLVLCCRRRELSVDVTKLSVYLGTILIRKKIAESTVLKGTLCFIDNKCRTAKPNNISNGMQIANEIHMKLL